MKNFRQLICFLLVPSTLALSDYFFTVTKSNTRLVSSLLYTLTNINVQQCVVECSKNNKCWSVNHHNIKSICELNKAVSGTMKDQLMTSDIGWNYFEKSEEVKNKIQVMKASQSN